MTRSEASRKYSSAQERRAELLELVAGQGYCTTLELSKALNVSDMTIRRDIRQLVDDGRLRSVHGGATLLPQSALTGTDFQARSGRMSAAKRAIAIRAATFLPESGAIALDAGTTTQELALAIPADSRLTVVTPSLAAVNALAGHENVEVMCVGGILHPQTQSFAGTATVAAISELRVRTLFLAASGITADGVYCGNDFDATTKRALVECADEVVLLADSGKFSTSAMVRVGSFDDVHKVVTDDGIAEEHLAFLAELGVEVVVAATERDPE